MKKILVVDDQLTIRELVEATLRSEQCQVLHADSGERAIDLVRAEKPDLILLDIMLPEGLDGYAVARTLKQDAATRQVPIIALTAKVQQIDREQAFAAGVDDYLAKPFSLKELRAKVERFLR
ncbi:hypothetical protein DESUT3_03990 [Desulfuromonas versatilis]|uniref:Response regulatory domain-containing protein n=1 Tax=Desulfuromonas versatilis TaxID=2802975 RepID=A0ABM8HM76_9BACT|nr:response regulator [Desulfuromonas versatilis]BCR03330.1 hypothetical protein DESUT3_03990 [Desulfuromonas versatilis]